MSFLEQVIRGTARIEERLDNLGGRGTGIHELASSVRPRLPDALFVRIRSIAAVRNKLAHEPDYRFDGNEADFLTSCDTVLFELGALQFTHHPTKSVIDDEYSMETISNTTHHPTKSVTDGAHTMKTISNTNWVEFGTPVWFEAHASTNRRRLLYMLGNTPVQILPDGIHSIPIFRSFDRIAFVTMGPSRVSFDLSGKTITGDGIAFQGEVSVELSVRGDDDSIETVALHAEEQEDLIRDRIFISLQAVARTLTYNQLDANRDQMMSKVLAEFTKNHSNGCAFSVDAVHLITLVNCPRKRGQG